MESEDEECFIMNFNAEPEDKINQEYSIMNADDPPNFFTPAKFPHTLAALNNPRLPVNKYATPTSALTTE